jgi:hypothetical protein
VLDAHRAIFTGYRDTLTLTLADVGTVVAAALEKLNPQLAADLDAGSREHRHRDAAGAARQPQRRGGAHR